MAELLTIHPRNPQPRLIAQAADILRAGGVAVYPTDSCYALGCQIGNKAGVERIRQIRELDDTHLMTLVCRDLSEIAQYAKVDNRQYRLLKNATPGPYTFILDATREVPRRLQHPKRATVGLRVPQHPVLQALLETLGEPLLSSSLQLPGDEHPLSDPYEIAERLERRVDLIIDGGACGFEVSTVVDLSSGEPTLLRVGSGDPARLGLIVH